MPEQQPELPTPYDERRMTEWLQDCEIEAEVVARWRDIAGVLHVRMRSGYVYAIDAGPTKMGVHLVLDYRARVAESEKTDEFKEHFVDANERMGEGIVKIGMALGLPRPGVNATWGVPEILEHIEQSTTTEYLVTGVNPRTGRVIEIPCQSESSMKDVVEIWTEGGITVVKVKSRTVMKAHAKSEWKTMEGGQ